MKSLFSWFRTVAFWEGVSYVFLMINMLVIKKMAPELGQQLVMPIGMAHGVLFIGYLVLAALTKNEYKRSFGWLIIAAIVSVIPFGTFFMEGKWKKEEEAFLINKTA